MGKGKSKKAKRRQKQRKAAARSERAASLRGGPLARQPWFAAYVALLRALGRLPEGIESVLIERVFGIEGDLLDGGPPAEQRALAAIARIHTGDPTWEEGLLGDLYSAHPSLEAALDELHEPEDACSIISQISASSGLAARRLAGGSESPWFPLHAAVLLGAGGEPQIITDCGTLRILVGWLVPQRDRWVLLALKEVADRELDAVARVVELEPERFLHEPFELDPSLKRFLLAPEIEIANITREASVSPWARRLALGDLLEGEELGPPPWDVELRCHFGAWAASESVERYAAKLASLLDYYPGREKGGWGRHFIRSASWRMTVARSRSSSELVDLERRMDRLHGIVEEEQDQIYDWWLLVNASKPELTTPSLPKVLEALGLQADGTIPSPDPTHDLTQLEHLPCSLLQLDPAHVQALELEPTTPIRKVLHAARSTLATSPPEPLATTCAEVLAAWVIFEDEERWLALAAISTPGWTEISMALALLFDPRAGQTPYTTALAPQRALHRRLTRGLDDPGASTLLDLPGSTPALLDLPGVALGSLTALRNTTVTYLQHHRYGPTPTSRITAWANAIPKAQPGHTDLAAGLDELAALYGSG